LQPGDTGRAATNGEAVGEADLRRLPFGVIEALKITKGALKGKAIDPEAPDFIQETIVVS
jgi:hypothetical protein